AAVSPLPVVNAIAVTSDGSVWLGTARGLARYRVDDDRRTLLEAFPDLGAGEIRALMVDERGMLWVAGDDGFFPYDGRALAQTDFAQKRWVQLGQADTVYPDETSSAARGHWRFNGAQDRWERYDAGTSGFAAFPLDKRAGNSAAALALLTTDS